MCAIAGLLRRCESPLSLADDAKASRAEPSTWELVERVFERRFENKTELRDHSIKLLHAASSEPVAKTQNVARKMGLYCRKLAKKAPGSTPLYFDAAFRRFVHEMHSDHKPRLTVGDKLGAGGVGVVSKVSFGSLRGIVQKMAHAAETNEIEEEAVIHHTIPPEKKYMLRGGIYLPFFIDRKIPSRLIYEAATASCAALLKKSGCKASHLQKSMMGLVEALTHFHTKGFVHLDVKLENLLLCSDGRIVLSDFGGARTTGEKPGVYTPQYASPEAVNNEPATPAMDMFSLGMVLYASLAQKPMFEGENSYSISVQIYGATQELLDAQVDGLDRLDSIEERDPTGHARHLVKALLRKVAEERPSIDHVATHPYCAGGGEEELFFWEMGLPSRSLSRSQVSEAETVEIKDAEVCDDNDDSFERFFCE